MLQIEKRAPRGTTAIDSLTLPYDDRKKSRLRAQSDSGREIAIVLSRGSMLREGDLLEATTGEVLVVRAAKESVSEVRSDDALLLSRVAYHLGNRHVPLQIDEGLLRYQHDHVLDDMVRELGLRVERVLASFQPEGGAYGHAHAGHSHDHSHDHAHTNDHDHAFVRTVKTHSRQGSDVTTAPVTFVPRQPVRHDD